MDDWFPRSSSCKGREWYQGNDNEDSRFNTMHIGTIRRILYERGLDIDGSRETLVASLKAVLEQVKPNW